MQKTNTTCCTPERRVHVTGSGVMGTENSYGLWPSTDLETVEKNRDRSQEYPISKKTTRLESESDIFSNDTVLPYTT